MPIRKELRHFYKGAEWQAVRARILARAGGACEGCGVPNRVVVLRQIGWWTPNTLDAVLYKHGGSREGGNPGLLAWRHAGVKVVQVANFATPSLARWVRIVLTIAHLNHEAGDNRDENLKALCQWCHFQHDKQFHAFNARRTRQARKDAGRPLLPVGGVA
jgi:5-methylcytosine-specific restriction endonuclease McrA